MWKLKLSTTTTVRQSRSVTRWHGARGKKQVWRPHVDPEVFRKQIHCNEESTFDIVGTFRRPSQWYGARGIFPPCYAPAAIFHLNNKEAKRELKVIFNHHTLSFLSEPKYLEVMLDFLRSDSRGRRYVDPHISSTPRITSEKADITRRTLEAAFGASGSGAGTTKKRTATLALVHSTAGFCVPAWCRSAHTCPIAPVINDALQPVTGCLRSTPADNLLILAGIQPASWASSHRSHTASSVRCHGAWTPAPFNAHLSTGCECTASQVETPFCTHRKTTHQFTWQQPQKCGALGGSPMECGVIGEHHETPYFRLKHRHPPSWNGPCQEQRGSRLIVSAPVSDVSAPVYTKWGYGPFCGL